jgi:ABC-type glycerol-3-phosphate transport system substrate-binding protein
MPHRPSRRTFLKGLAGAAAATPIVARRATAQTPVTVKYMTWWWAEKGRNDAWRGIVKKFHDAQKDIRIQEVGFPYSEFFQRVTTQLAGGRLDADVLSFYDELGIRLIKTGALSPVDDVVQKLGIQEKLDKTVHQFVTAGGKLYGLLGVNVPYALIYNRDLYQAAGIAKAPTSQEEYIQVAKRLTKRPDQFGHAARSTMPEQNGWWSDISHWVMGYNGQWVKGKKPQLTEAPVINAIKAYKRLYDESMPQGADASTYRRMAWEGKIAQYIDNSANIGILKSGNPAIYPKIFTAPPPWENHRAINIPNYVGIYAGSPQRQGAAAFLEFVYRPENFQQLMEAALDIYPPYQGAVREAYLKELHWVSGYLASKGSPIPALVEGLESNIAEVRQIVLSQVSQVLTAGKAPEAAMADAQKSVEELAARV